MAALTASTTISVSSLANNQSLSQAYDRYISASSAPLNLVQHREKFQDRALRDVTVHINDSAMMMDPSNPLLVKDEMEAQKEYFRRLKFTYLEQEAKRYFLFSITGDEPQGVQPGENEQLEQSNAQKKAALKATKADIDQMQVEALQLAKGNATKHAEIQKQLAEAQSIYKQIADMELELKRIKATHPPESRLMVHQAIEMLDAQTVQIEALTEGLSSTAEKTDYTAEEVVRTRREAMSEHELHLEYDVPATSGETGSVVMVLHFDSATRRLTSAAVSLRSALED
ncbi:MAG: hypothetical protein TREMPRED_005287 [Tremellales sp. Tagirdzhanova-0007]|nr:MAG: hypothetical protein TREMPRED_005287 [Tremellales sp. Tagirdzhanova-0007]